MRFGWPARTLGAVTDEDFEKLAQLNRMKRLALWLLAAMAVVFAFSFALQDQYPWLSYVRAASEGGMVGAIADWFAVTALFRHPLGIRIPHTNLIANKKDDIGEGLGSFIEQNFLADDVIHEKLSTISGARVAGKWLKDRGNAEKISDLTATVGLSALTVLDDRDVQDLIETLARNHLIEPKWSPTLGIFTTQILDGGHHETAVDLVAEHVIHWLEAHPDAFNELVSSRLPTWLPSVASKLVDRRLYTEALRFVEAVHDDREHPFRLAANEFLRDLAHDLEHRADLMNQVETLKHEIFDSPRMRSLAVTSWAMARDTLTELLSDPRSELRVRLTNAFQDFGAQLRSDSTLQFKIDVWVMTAVEHLVHTYRRDLAQVVSDTVQRWDATEAAAKIELQIGKDLQFIRINGTVVGSLAGLLIFVIATSVAALIA